MNFEVYPLIFLLPLVRTITSFFLFFDKQDSFTFIEKLIQNKFVFSKLIRMSGAGSPTYGTGDNNVLQQTQNQVIYN